MIARAVRSAAVAVAVCVLCKSARTHIEESCSLDLRADGQGLYCTLTVRNGDLASVLARDDHEALSRADYFTRRKALLQSLVDQRLRLTADGAALAVTVNNASHPPHDLAEIETALLMLAPWQAPPSRLQIECALIPQNPAFETLATLCGPTGKSTQVALTQREPRVEWEQPAGVGKPPRPQPTPDVAQPRTPAGGLLQERPGSRASWIGGCVLLLVLGAGCLAQCGTASTTRRQHRLDG